MRPPHTAVMAMLLWSQVCGACDGEQAGAAPPPAVTARSGGSDAGTGWDFGLSQRDIPPAPDPRLRHPARFLPEAVDAGVLDVADAAAVELDLDATRALDALSDDEATMLCQDVRAYLDAAVSRGQLGQARCVYALGAALGIEDAMTCQEALSAVEPCPAAGRPPCDGIDACNASVAELDQCVRELGAMQAAWAHLFSDCALFDDAGVRDDVTAIAARPLACEALWRACPDTLRVDVGAW